MTTTPELPPPGVQSAEDRCQISRQLIIHAREELAVGSRLQAGEKAWGAVVQPMKAIAEQRGWPHQSHRDVREVLSQVALEYGFDYDQIEAMSQAYWIGHENFYENKYSTESLTAMIDRVEDVAPYLIELTTAQPRPFTITSNVQLRRLRRLTGNDRLEIGDTSPVGFSRNHPLP
ncbi:MAG: hypothetical protein OXI54_00740 [Chloroflexota bacterium]|nr:hypothetical protein [Chloroflexota bacterium]MDE2682667.1 hypothetical protein [Chloroflexota bacterium]